MKFPVKMEDKPQPVVKKEAPTIAPKPIPIVNMQGFGKAGNNAIDIMINNGYFSGEDTDLKLTMSVYKELTKKIYYADIECVEEIKNGN